MYVPLLVALKRTDFGWPQVESQLTLAGDLLQLRHLRTLATPCMPPAVLLGRVLVLSIRTLVCLSRILAGHSPEHQNQPEHIAKELRFLAEVIGNRKQDWDRRRNKLKLTRSFAFAKLAARFAGLPTTQSSRVQCSPSRRRSGLVVHSAGHRARHSCCTIRQKQWVIPGAMGEHLGANFLKLPTKRNKEGGLPK